MLLHDLTQETRGFHSVVNDEKIGNFYINPASPYRAAPARLRYRLLCLCLAQHAGASLRGHVWQGGSSPRRGFNHSRKRSITSIWGDNGPISIYHLGWKQHLFWSQTLPIYPNSLHNIVALVLKRQLKDKKKIIRNHPKVDIYIISGHWSCLSASPWRWAGRCCATPPRSPTPSAGSCRTR